MNDESERSRSLPVIASVLVPLALALALGLSPRHLELSAALQGAQNAHSPDESAEALRVILAVEPWRSDLWEQLGRAEQECNDPAAAAAAYQKAAGWERLSADGQHRLGDVYLELGNSEAAIQTWLMLIKDGGADRSIYMQTAALLRSEGNIPGAAVVLETWLQLSPDDADVHYQLGLLLASDDPESALVHLETAGRSEQETIPPAGHLTRALRTALFEDDPAYQQVLTGRALASLGHWDLSVRAFERAVNLAPQYAEAWALLGEARYQLDGSGQAALERANALAPQSTVVQALTALYLRRQGSAEQALDALLEVAAAEPQEAIWQVEIGSLLAEMGDLGEAQTHFKMAVEIDAHNAVNWYYLARFYLTNHMDVRAQALPAARQALLLAPEDARMADLMGWVMLELDDAASAERFFMQAIAEDPLFNLAYLHLGQLYVIQGEDEMAARFLSRAIELSIEGDPVFVLAERLLNDRGE